MKPEEHTKEGIRLQRNITRLRNISKGPMTLKQKLEVKDRVRIAEEALRQHRLHFFDLTSNATPSDAA